MSIDEKADRLPARSHLFMLRLWLERMGGGQTDWRGRVQHVNSGEVLYFRDWPTLAAFVEALVRENEPRESGAQGMEQANSRSQ